jgi:hypothetical protein
VRPAARAPERCRDGLGREREHFDTLPVHPSSTEVALLDKKLQPRQLSIRVTAKKALDLTDR